MPAIVLPLLSDGVSSCFIIMPLGSYSKARASQESSPIDLHAANVCIFALLPE